MGAVTTIPEATALLARLQADGYEVRLVAPDRLSPPSASLGALRSEGSRSGWTRPAGSLSSPGQG